MEGTSFGRYQLQALLGRGGMGEVWRAFDTETHRIVAVKVLPAHLADDEEFQQRFRHEALTAAALNEPHVVPIHSFGEIDGRLYVDMRLVEGQDLQSVLAAGPLEPARAVAIVEQVASALDAAHRSGLIHRDVKPSNILLGDGDFAYLIDFGIARSVNRTALTNVGVTIGTWAYMAPERFSGGQTDARADVYALTCVFYQTLTGQQPFSGDGFEQLASAHLWTPPPLASQARPGLPPALDAVITGGMAKDPDERYPTTKHLAAAARAALTSTSPWAPAPQAFAEAHPAPPVTYPYTSPLAATQHNPQPFSAPAHSHTGTPNGQTPHHARPWWRRVPAIAAAAAALVTVVATVITLSVSGHQSRHPATPSTEAFQGPFVPACGGINEQALQLVTEVPNLVAVAKNSVSCQWLQNGDANGPRFSFVWYRGTPIEVERKTEEASRNSVDDLKIDGHDGFVAVGTDPNLGNNLCEVGVQLYSSDDYIEWSIIFSQKPFPDPCTIAKKFAADSIAAIGALTTISGKPDNTSALQFPNLLRGCQTLAPDIAAVVNTAEPDVTLTFTGVVCGWHIATGSTHLKLTRSWFALGNLDNERRVAQSLKYQIEDTVIADVPSIVTRPDDPNGACGVASDAAGVVGWWVNPDSPGVDACSMATSLMEHTLTKTP